MYRLAAPLPVRRFPCPFVPFVSLVSFVFIRRPDSLPRGPARRGNRRSRTQRLSAEELAVCRVPEVNLPVARAGRDPLAIRAGGHGVDPVGRVVQLPLL